PPPAGPPGKPTEPKPSAFLMPYQLIAGSAQPIHGLLNPSLADFNGSQPTVAVSPANYVEPDLSLVKEAAYSSAIVEKEPSTVSNQPPVQSTPVISAPLVSTATSQPSEPVLEKSTGKEPLAAETVEPDRKVGLTPDTAQSLPAQESDHAMPAQDKVVPPAISMVPSAERGSAPAEELGADSNATPEEIAPAVTEPENSSGGSTSGITQQAPTQAIGADI